MRFPLLYLLLALVFLFAGCFPFNEQQHSQLLDLGTSQYGLYENKYFGFSVKIPDQWSYQPPSVANQPTAGLRLEALTITDSVAEADKHLW